MSQWKNTNDSANGVNWAVQEENTKASGHANKAANNTALFNNASPGSFVSNKVVGLMGVQVAARANTSGEGTKVHAVGWNRRTQGMGPVLSLTVNTAASSNNFVTGETGQLVSTGGVSGKFTVTANATGNLSSVAVNYGGTFVNAAGVAVAFNRETHLGSITVGGTPVGYNNTDVITAVANVNYVAATATVLTNTTGGFVSANVTITNPGLFGNTQVAANVGFTVANSTGGASAGTGATFTAVLANSAGGSLVSPVLGGRAGRVHYECLVESSSIKTGAGSNTSLLPLT